MVAIQNPQVHRPAVVEWSADSASEISSVDTQPVQHRQPRRYNRHRDGSSRTVDETDHWRHGRRSRRGHLRQYNENLLRQLKEMHEIELEDEDFVPGYTTRESALSTLMSDDICMEEWYKSSMNECYDDGVAHATSEETKESKCDNSNNSSVEDQRKVHPAAVSPAVAYGRISWRLRRGLLRRRQLPTEEMNDVEGELRQHFSQRPREWPRIMPPLSRLITHAVAEYLGLHSRSEDLASELLMKKILVSNRCSEFSPPHVHLTTYLSQLQR